jgi:hypothetical protein
VQRAAEIDSYRAPVHVNKPSSSADALPTCAASPLASVRALSRPIWYPLVARRRSAVDVGTRVQAGQVLAH